MCSSSINQATFRAAKSAEDPVGIVHGWVACEPNPKQRIERKPLVGGSKGA